MSSGRPPQRFTREGLRASPELNRLLLAVAFDRGCSVADIYGHSREEPAVTARMLAVYATRTLLKWSFGRVARAFDKHGPRYTILTCKAVQGRLDTEPALRGSLDRIKKLAKLLDGKAKTPTGEPSLKPEEYAA